MVKKLVPNLLSKTRYVIHYRNLMYYIPKGLSMTKIYRVLEFNQSAWLANYIDIDTGKRELATSPFEKDLFKLGITRFLESLYKI